MLASVTRPGDVEAAALALARMSGNTWIAEAHPQPESNAHLNSTTTALIFWLDAGDDRTELGALAHLRALEL